MDPPPFRPDSFGWTGRPRHFWGGSRQRRTPASKSSAIIILLPHSNTCMYEKDCEKNWEQTGSLRNCRSPQWPLPTPFTQLLKLRFSTSSSAGRSPRRTYVFWMTKWWAPPLCIPRRIRMGHDDHRRLALAHRIIGQLHINDGSGRTSFQEGACRTDSRRDFFSANCRPTGGYCYNKPPRFYNPFRFNYVL